MCVCVCVCVCVVNNLFVYIFLDIREDANSPRISHFSSEVRNLLVSFKVVFLVVYDLWSTFPGFTNQGDSYPSVCTRIFNASGKNRHFVFIC